MLINPIASFNTKDSRNKQFRRPNVEFKAALVKEQTVDDMLNYLREYLGKRIMGSGHSSLDDDSGCSLFLAKHFFKHFGIDITPYIRSEQKRKLYIDKIYKNNTNELKTKLTKKPDVIFSVDFNDVLKIPKLLAEMFEGNWKNAPKVLREWKKGEVFEGVPRIGVDHHINENNTKGKFYFDTTAKSCSGIWVRMFQAKNIEMSVEDCKLAYCGMLSDYEKSGMVKFSKNKLIMLPKLLEDKNSLEVLQMVEKKISAADKREIHKHLNIMERLNKDEKAFKKKLSSMIKLSPDKKLAYVEINPNDKDWAKIGMDNDTTSYILRWFRMKVLEGSKKVLSAEQQKMFKDIKAVAIFYRTSPKWHGSYRVSIHSKDGYSEKLMRQAEADTGMNIGGGHPDRMGGKIQSVDKAKAKEFVGYFLRASQQLSGTLAS